MFGGHGSGLALRIEDGTGFVRVSVHCGEDGWGLELDERDRAEAANLRIRGELAVLEDGSAHVAVYDAQGARTGPAEARARARRRGLADVPGRRKAGPLH